MGDRPIQILEIIYILGPISDTFTNTAVLQQAGKGNTVDPDGSPSCLLR